MSARADRTPSSDEAAAIAAAIERFTRDTAAPPSEPPVTQPSRWLQAALVEGVTRQPDPTPLP